MNKTLQKLLAKKIDSSSSILEKSLYFLAVGLSSLLGTTVATQAASINVADNVIVTSSTSQVTDSVITMTTAIDAGNNTFTATYNAAIAFTVTSMTFGDTETQASVIIVDNGVLTSTNIATVANTGEWGDGFVVAEDAQFKITGNVAETGTNGDVTFEVEGGGAAHGLHFAGGVQAIAGTIDSDTGEDGNLLISGVGIKTFAETVGANEKMNVNVATGSSATFSAISTVRGLVNVGTTIYSAGANADTINNTGTLTFTGVNGADTLEDSAANGLSVVSLGNGSNTTFTLASGQTTNIKATIDASIAGQGTINFVNSDDTSAAVQTITSHIGNSKKLDVINIGATTKAGSLIGTNAMNIKANTINIVGGNAAGEDSLLALLENAEGSVVLTTAGGGDATIKAVTNVVTLTGSISVGTVGAGDSIIDVDKDMIVTGNITGVEKGTILGGEFLKLKGATNEIASLIGTDAAELDFAGTTDQSFTGLITFAANDDGVLSNSNDAGIVTFNNIVGATGQRATSITLADDSRTVFKEKIFTKKLDINTSGTVTTFEAKNSAIGIGNAGSVEVVAGARIKLGKAFVADDVVLDGALLAAGGDGAVIAGDITIVPSANFRSGSIVFLQTDNATLSDAEFKRILLQDNALTDYTTTLTAHDVNIIATVKTPERIATELGVSKNSARSLTNLMEATLTDSAAASAMDTLLVSNLGVSKNAAVKEVLEQVSPQAQTISGSSQAVNAMTGTVQGIVANRMASLRSGDAYVSGMSAGNGMSANSGFIQAFGSESEQKNNKIGAANILGYDSETSGVAVGFDGMTNNGSTVGLSASFSSTDVEGKGTAGSKNSIESYTVSVYADKATDMGYVEGSLTYGINENDISRKINTGGLNRLYKGAYDSQQVSLNISAGAPNEVGNGGFVTPFGGVTTTVISTDSYTETSNTASDALRFKVAQDDVTSVIGTVGVKAHMVTDKGTPMISLAVNNEFGDTAINTNNTFTGGGTAFKTKTDVEEMSATLGLGYSVGSDMTSLNIGYEANADDNKYLSHYGSIKIISKF